MMSGDDMDDELSSDGSGDEIQVINGHNKRIPTAPSGSSVPSRRRNRKAGSDAIVEAMQEISAASKLRSAALSKKNGDRFSISKCTKATNNLQGVRYNL
ncbi:unnamed protein product [Eruca vesicaria subsp. sativa]|uniref:Uncharacterized protein n=1 Tax=Eruca vesicaria subsp. sativa TaxID=29727 RepID=A0ABC8IMA0_ERUVS|nr:unnamed protein product [Eruca vesicaria subsp. sativa]